MAKYRLKPVMIEIEAEQWFPDRQVEGVEKGVSAPFKAGTYRVGEPIDISNKQPIGIIQTLKGTLPVSPGDWIITKVTGEKYPVKNEIFLDTYELVT